VIAGGMEQGAGESGIIKVLINSTNSMLHAKPREWVNNNSPGNTPGKGS